MGFSLCVSLNDDVSQFARQSGEDSGVTLRKAVLHLTQVSSVNLWGCASWFSCKDPSGYIQIPGRIMCLSPCLLFLGALKESHGRAAHMLTPGCM